VIGFALSLLLVLLPDAILLPAKMLQCHHHCAHNAPCTAGDAACCCCFLPSVYSSFIPDAVALCEATAVAISLLMHHNTVAIDAVSPLEGRDESGLGQQYQQQIGNCVASFLFLHAAIHIFLLLLLLQILLSLTQEMNFMKQHLLSLSLAIKTSTARDLSLPPSGLSTFQLTVSS